MFNSSTPVVVIHGNQVTTTSRAIAEYFGKQHKNVIQSIESLKPQCGEKFTELNFQPSEYTDSTGRKLPAYCITRDGFTLLAMGFTGKKALQFKLDYIEAFNRMEAQLGGKSISIDVRALMLEGQSDPTVPLPPQISEAIDLKAWDLAREAYELSRQHLQRRVAYCAERGYPQRVINEDRALQVIERGNLDDALAHSWVEKIESLRSLAGTYVNMGQQLIEKLDEIDF